MLVVWRARVTNRMAESVARRCKVMPIKRVDEFALHKGQSYATVFADAETRQLLWVGKGRGKADIRPFFVLANFGKQVLDRIRVNEANRCRDDKAARELIQGPEADRLWIPG